MKIKTVLLALLFPLIFNSCIVIKYVYFERDKVLLKDVDVDGTLDIAQLKLEEGGFDSTLTLWALRDQVITPGQAERISGLYLEHIVTIDNEFGIWHLAWAVSNFYRLGDEGVREKLKGAYDDAVTRPGKLKQFKDIANEHVNGTKIYMGYVHDLGKSYAFSHLIVPGNKDYLQSFDEFVEKNRNDKKLMEIIKNSQWLKK